MNCDGIDRNDVDDLVGGICSDVEDGLRTRSLRRVSTRAEDVRRTARGWSCHHSSMDHHPVLLDTVALSQWQLHRHTSGEEEAQRVQHPDSVRHSAVEVSSLSSWRDGCGENLLESDSSLSEDATSRLWDVPESAFETRTGSSERRAAETGDDECEWWWRQWQCRRINQWKRNGAFAYALSTLLIRLGLSWTTIFCCTSIRWKWCWESESEQYQENRRRFSSNRFFGIENRGWTKELWLIETMNHRFGFFQIFISMSRLTIRVGGNISLFGKSTSLSSLSLFTHIARWLRRTRSKRRGCSNLDFPQFIAWDEAGAFFLSIIAVEVYRERFLPPHLFKFPSSEISINLHRSVDGICKHLLFHRRPHLVDLSVRPETGSIVSYENRDIFVSWREFIWVLSFSAEYGYLSSDYDSEVRFALYEHWVLNGLVTSVRK